MTIAVDARKPIPWYKEPTKDQWLAWVAAWLGWTLDAFDFTIFLLIMLPISQEFHVPLTAVTAVFTITLWMRLVGATASGWLADRIGRKKPLMISIAWYSVVQLHRRLFADLLVPVSVPGLARHRHGSGMAVRRGIGDGKLADPLARVHGRRPASLVGPRRPAVERGLWPALYVDRLARSADAWRAAGAVRSSMCARYVKEPPVWVENRRLQRTQQREVKVPLLKIFKRGLLGNTLTACWWMASAFVVGYSVGGMFPTYLQKDLHLSPGLVALPVMLQSIVFFLSGSV